MSNSSEDETLSFDYLNLLFSGQAFSDVTFTVDGRLVHAHRCILAARSPFFRRFFCSSSSSSASPDHHRPSPTGHHPSGSATRTMITGLGSPRSGTVIPVNSVSYEVFMILLQFLYSGRVSVVPPKHEPRPDCGKRGCWHTHCSSAVDLALSTLAAARTFGVEQLALLVQKELMIMVDKASVEDVMKVLVASRKHEMHQLWTTCSHLVANSGLQPGVLAKHLPFDVAAKIEDLRLKSSLALRSLLPHSHHHHHDLDLSSAAASDLKDHHIQRMRRALDSSDVELVKLMVMGEGLNLDEALALHYAVQNCTREVVKALLELEAANVNYPAGPTGKTPLHLAAEMVSPDMVAVLLDHHADPNSRTMDGVTPLDVLRSLTSDFLFKGAIPGMVHIEPNKLRLCLELVQSAAVVIMREEGNAEQQQGSAPGAMFSPHPVPSMSTNQDHNGSTASSGGARDVGGGGNLGNVAHHDSRLVYLNLGSRASVGDDGGGGSSGGRRRPHGNPSIYPHHHSHDQF